MQLVKYSDRSPDMLQCLCSRKQEWAQPTKPYGFWTSDAANAKYNFNKEPGHMSLPGRGSPHGGETRLRMS